MVIRFRVRGVQAYTHLVHPSLFQHRPGQRGQVLARFGRDKGFDIPVRTDYVRALKPLLDAVGLRSDLTVILFTLDETVYSRELAPLAGHYPAMKIGPAWWFYDSLQGMKRYREAICETAGLYNTVGFNDDTRAYPSIPARHDLSRRVDANWIAGMVVRGVIDVEDAQTSDGVFPDTAPRLREGENFVGLDGLQASGRNVIFADDQGLGTILNDDFFVGRVFNDVDNDGVYERLIRLQRRLKPVDTSSPRATLDGFLDSVNRAYVLVMQANLALSEKPPGMSREEAREIEDRAARLLERATAVLDLSRVPKALRVAMNHSGPDVCVEPPP